MITEKLIENLDGKDVVELSLTSDLAEVKILNYGCVVRDWRVKTSAGMVPVILGLDDYMTHRDSLPSGGAICGRVANRIEKGRFSLDGKDYTLPINDGPNHLHGGPGGFDKVIWDYTLDHDANAVTFTLHSPDGDQGYPGNVDVSVTMCLEGTSLIYDMSATTDTRTPINLAQHTYYNLDGEGDVFSQIIQARASHYTPTDADLIPTGEIAPVAGTMFDFSSPTTYAATDPDRIGVDINLVLDADRDVNEPAVTVLSEKSGLKLQMWTEEPGLQMFNASWMDIKGYGLDGRTYVAFSGICLEPQHYPDSVNNPDWPSTIVTPDKPYHQSLRVDIAPI